jgi:hypothetical protein
MRQPRSPSAPRRLAVSRREFDRAGLCGHPKRVGTKNVPLDFDGLRRIEQRTAVGESAMLDDGQLINVKFACCNRTRQLALGQIRNIPPPYVVACPCGCGSLATYDKLELLQMLNKTAADGPFNMIFKSA